MRLGRWADIYAAQPKLLYESKRREASTGDDDLMPFGVPVAALWVPTGSVTEASGSALSFAATASTMACASIASIPWVSRSCTSSWAGLLGDTLTVSGREDQEDHPSPITVGGIGVLLRREEWRTE